MDPAILKLLCSPGDKLSLQTEGEELVAANGLRFRIREGIPILMNSPQRGGRFYDAVAFAYDATIELGVRLGLGSEARIREEILKPIRLEPASLVLEIGCGTGSNRSAFDGSVNYIGIDNSFGMLRVAKRKNEGLGLSAALVQAHAEELPIADGAAQLALAMGVMQHVQTPRLALQEMQHVLAAGGQLIIFDEKRSWNRLTQRTVGKKAEPEEFLNWLSKHQQLETHRTDGSAHGAEFEPGYFEINEYFCLRLIKTHNNTL